MEINYISSSKLKKNVSEVLHDAHYKGVVTVIEKYGKPIAKIIPYKKDINESMKLSDFYGLIPDFPDVTKDRTFKRKNISL